MRLPIPSFRVQIILLVSVLLAASVLMFRSYFIGSFQEFRSQIEYLQLNEKINTLYRDYADEIPDGQSSEQFRSDIENLLIDVNQIDLAGDIFDREIKLYSIFIFVFLILTVLIIFLISFGLITRPLARLQAATKELARGNLNIRVTESKFSPINDLIVSFNAMTTELVENRNKLLEAEKEVMWREMAQVMAHEIKNPLTPIRLQMQRMEHKYLMASDDFEKTFNDGIKIVNEEVENLQILVNQFRNFAKMPSASFEKYNLKTQMEEILLPYESQVDLRLDIAEQLPEFYGDKMQMKQVFVNLIQNAIQSMDSDLTLRVGCHYEKGKFVITIEDHGGGIDKDDLEKIFQPYFTRKKKGTGLGLAIVKRIVQTHDGSIKVDSEKGKGTKFTIIIGVSENEAARYPDLMENFR